MSQSTVRAITSPPLSVRAVGGVQIYLRAFPETILGHFNRRAAKFGSFEASPEMGLPSRERLREFRLDGLCEMTFQ